MSLLVPGSRSNRRKMNYTTFADHRTTTRVKNNAPSDLIDEPTLIPPSHIPQLEGELQPTSTEVYSIGHLPGHPNDPLPQLNMSIYRSKTTTWSPQS